MYLYWVVVYCTYVPVYTRFNVELRMSRFDWFEFDSNIFICINITAEINIPKRPGSDFPPEPKWRHNESYMTTGIISRLGNPEGKLPKFVPDT